MKCHNILGIKESAKAAEIETACNQKLLVLNSQKESIGERAYEKKRAEIRTAREDCECWLNSSPVERLKTRARDIPRYAQNRMYSTIGCCTCCNDSCGNGNDSFCDMICCSECQSVPRFCDIFLWIALGATGGFFLLCAIFRAIAKAIRNSRQTAYDNAVQNLPSLRAEASRLSAQLQVFSEDRKLQQERERELNAFSNFFESMGAVSADSLQAAEHERVEKQATSEQSLRTAYNQIVREINNAERIIRRRRP